MKRFEYSQESLVEDWSSTFDTEGADKIRTARLDWLNRFGHVGWEIIKIDSTATGTSIVLKRELP